MQLSGACKADSEMIVACPYANKPSLVNDGLDRCYGCVDKRLEDWIDQSSDRLALLSWCGDGNAWSLRLMRLYQNEHAIRQQMFPGSLEGMDHALDCDSSKRPGKECDLEGFGTDANPFS